MKTIFFQKWFVQIISIIGMICVIFPSLYSYGKYISLITIFLISPYLLREIFYEKLFSKNEGSLFAFIFIIGYCITILMSAKTDLISTLHGFIWIIINFLVVYSYNKKIDIEEKKKQLFFLNNILITLSIVFSLISLYLYFNLISIEISGRTIGVVSGRNTGITIDSIQLSWINFIGICSSLINLVFPKKRIYNILLIFVLIINFICLETTITRNTVYSVIALLAIFTTAYYFCSLDFNKNKARKIITFIFIGLLSISSFLLIDNITKNVLSKVVTSLEENKNSVISTNDQNEENKFNIVMLSLDSSQNEVSSNNNSITNINVNDVIKKSSNDSDDNDDNKDYYSREEDQYGFKYGLSGRYEIWMCGINVVKAYPIFGVSTGDMVYQTYKENENSPYLKLFIRPTVFTSQHNGMMQVLVASGFFGLIFSTLAVITGLFKIVKNIFLNYGNIYKEKKLIATLFSIIFTMFFIMNIGQTVTYFMVSFINTYFWFIMHYLMYFSEKKENK